MAELMDDLDRIDPIAYIKALQEENSALVEQNDNLSKHVARKYTHVSKLRGKIARLKLELKQTAIFESQSGTTDIAGAIVDHAPASQTSTQQITTFEDEAPGFSTTVDAAYDQTMDAGMNSDSDLGNYLRRPIKLATIEWQVGQSLLTEINPWELLHDNSFFQSKIRNFELLRHKLKVKVVVSGTPFHYGRLLVSYNPYFFSDEVTVVRSAVPQDLIQLSQRPHIWIDPANNLGGELSLPFFYPRNYVSITRGDHRFLGKLDIQSSQPLRHANGGDDAVYISIFAWAEDICLSVPTSNEPDSLPTVFESQSNVLTNASMDEYGMGIVSEPASSVAKAAGLLTRIPIIGPYMRATEVAANKVGMVAKLFGFSRPPVVTDPTLFKPFPQGNLANTDAAETVSKLSLDSKAEVTIDPRVVGLGGHDEMGIIDFVKRESFLCDFPMTETDGPGASIFEARVNPITYDSLDGTDDIEYHLPPCAYLAQAFEYWHGSMTYKFQIVKSKFHKGKIVVQYDPMYLPGVTEQFNTNYSRIVDLGAEDEFEITIGWCQSEPWCRLPSIGLDKRWSSTGSYGSAEPGVSNGLFRVSVLNKLVSPSLDTDISFNVFVRMNDDAKFARPTPNKLDRLSLFSSLPLPPSKREIFDSQSGIAGAPVVNQEATAPTGANAIQSINKVGQANDHYHEVFFGECPTSLRQMLKRYTFHQSHVVSLDDVSTLSNVNIEYKMAPFFRGSDASAPTLDSLGRPFAFYNQTFWQHFTPCYAGYRGALRKKLIFSNATDVEQQPKLSWGTDSNAGSYVQTSTAFSTDPDILRSELSGRVMRSTGGQMTTNLGINNTLEVELPYYKEERFIPARSISYLTRDNRRLVLDVTTGERTNPKLASVDEYIAVGDDFSLHFFTGCPILYQYTTPTPA